MESSGVISPEAAGLMAGGSVVALLGVWLMLMEGAAGTAKIAFFGSQVQAVPLGFAVFLAGSGAAISPLVAPDEVTELVSEVADQAGLAAGYMPGAEEREGEGSVPADTVKRDIEPLNNKMEGANLLKLGEIVSGKHSGDDWDWYLLDTKSAAGREIIADVSVGSNACDAFFYDWQQRFLGAAVLSVNARQTPVEVGDSPGLYVQLACPADTPERDYAVGFNVVE